MNQDERKLSIEQEFSQRVFSDRVQELSRESAQELLIKMHEQMLYRENMYKQLVLSQGKTIIDGLFGAR